MGHTPDVGRHIVKLILPGGTVSNTASRFPPLFSRIMTNSTDKKAIDLYSFYELLYLLDVDDHRDAIERHLKGQSRENELPIPYADAAASARSVRNDANYEDVLTILEERLRKQLCMVPRVENVELSESPKFTLRLSWNP